VVTNPGSQAGTLPAAFTVTYPPPLLGNAAPTVTSITPNSGPNSGSVSITALVGTGFLPGATVKLTKSAQPDIVAAGVTVVNPTTITCTFNLVGAAAGAWDVTVTNTDTKSGILVGGFTVTNPAPTVTSIAPNTGISNATVNVTSLVGTGFLPGATVKLAKTAQADIVATGVTVVNPTTITCTLVLTGAAAGPWDVTVTNTDAQSGTLTGGFTVNNLSAPTMNALPTYTIGTALTASWTGIDPSATHSDVQCSTDPAFGTIAADSGWLAVPTASFGFTSLTLGQTYYYRAQVGLQVAGVTVATSPWSNVVSSTQRSANPTLAYTGDTLNTYGNPITVSAQLTSSGTPVQGIDVGFVVSTFAAHATTDANGNATVTVPANTLYGGTYTVFGTSAAANGYTAATCTGSLTVTSATLPTPDTNTIDGNGSFLKGAIPGTIKFHFGYPSGAGFLNYTDNSVRKTITAIGVATVLLPSLDTATISGNCTFGTTPTTYTLTVVVSTNSFTLTTGTGYSNSGTLKAGTITIK
jgi:hypothetical protein